VHAPLSEIGCAGTAGNIQRVLIGGLKMYGYIGGVTDTDEINFCPYCGENVSVMHADGTVTCDSCKRRFGVAEIDEE
jgi:hypothetical protein